jgi:hypothetical protein
MVDRIKSVLANNRPEILAAFALFIANQLVEFTVVYLFEFNHRNLCAWDCTWYSSLVSHGYDLEPHRNPKGDMANWAFFPLFSYLAKALQLISGLPASISVVVTGKIFFLAAILAFIKFGRTYSPDLNPLLLGSVLALNPYAIYGNTGYTEPLFLLGSCAFFIALKKENYLTSGLLGGLLSSIRFVGAAASLSYILLAIPKFIRSSTQDRLRIYTGLLFVPSGLAAFMLYLYFHTGDALAFANIQTAWGRELQNPFMLLKQGLTGNAFEKYLAVTAIYGIACSVFFVGRRQFELAIFTAICTILPLTTSLTSLPRYVWWQAPVLLASAMLISRRQAWAIFTPVYITTLVFMYYGWFNGKVFVI